MAFPTAAFFLAAAYLISLVSISQDNEPITVSFPTCSSAFRVNDNVCIKWTSKKDDRVILKIFLLEHPSDPLDASHIIATFADANKEEYIWTIPENIPSGYNYTIAFDIGGQVVFSDPFIIFNDSHLQLI